ncbi:MAG: hypothetical protein ACREB5_05660 [Sphingomonadaceae bacterium]
MAREMLMMGERTVTQEVLFYEFSTAVPTLQGHSTGNATRVALPFHR